jgi:DeoR/GlpR family transcriptional regulator of sugar metabolism
VRGEVQVKELVARCGVSEMTIRRDLESLEQRGLLRRCYGGARIQPQPREIMHFEKKDGIKQEEKRLIASAISDMIEPGSTMFCNAGTTTLAVISRIRDANIRIITNNAMAPAVPLGESNELICTGGQYHIKTRSFVGEFAASSISRVYADVCVMGVNGVSVSGGCSTDAYNETQINEMMVRRCKGMKIIAADGSKIGRTACFTSLLLNQLDMLVTDSSANRDEIARIRQLGLRVFICNGSGQDLVHPSE